jgi:hypothetical protein
MKFEFSVVVPFAACLGIGACVQEPPRCLNVSKDEAIKLARERKDHMRLNAEERPKWVSDEIRSVELRNVSDGNDIGAVVTFLGDESGSPVALIYGDCDVEWSLREATS